MKGINKEHKLIKQFPVYQYARPQKVKGFNKPDTYHDICQSLEPTNRMRDTSVQTLRQDVTHFVINLKDFK